MAADHPSSEEASVCGTTEPAVKEEVAPEAENGNIRKNSHSSNITESPSSKVKTETIDVEPEGDTSAGKGMTNGTIVSNFMESDGNLVKEESIEEDKENIAPTSSNNCTSRDQEDSFIEGDLKLHREEDIEDILEEDIGENIDVDIKEDEDDAAQESVDNHATIGNDEFSLMENDLKCRSKEDSEQVIKLHKEEDIEDNVEEDFVENIEVDIKEDGEGVAQTSFNNRTVIRNHTDNVVESDLKRHKEEDKKEVIDGNVRCPFVKLHKEEIKEIVEEDKKEVVQTSHDKYATILNHDVRGLDDKLFESSTKWDPIYEENEKKLYSKFNVFQSDTKCGHLKDENDSVKYYVDGSQQSGIYYDSSHIKLVDVSVVLEDLFLEIIRQNPRKCIKRHIKSKRCPCMFCTGKYKFHNSMKNLVQTNTTKKTQNSSKIPSESKDTNAFDSAVYVSSSDAATKPIIDSSKLETFCTDESHQSETYYDSSSIKLVDVSVVLEDLFQEISKRDPQKAVQKHINSKCCPCIFCARKPEPLSKLRERNASSKAMQSSHCIDEHLRELADKWNSCTFCPARFKFMYSLTRHSAMNHHVYLCSECTRKFPLESDLETHIKTHPANKSYVCALCCFKGRVEAELEIHARTHATEKLFSCAQCFTEFKKNYNLLRHIQEPTSTVASVENKTSLSERSTRYPRRKSVLNDRLSTLKQTPSFSTRSNKQSSAQTSCLSKFNQANKLNSNLTTNASVQSFSFDYSSKKFITKSPVEHHPVTHVSKCLVSNQNVAPQNKSTDLAKVNILKNVTEPSQCVGEHFEESTNKNWNSCTLCPAQFRFMHSLTRHCAVAHHVYLCPECSAKFQFESSLRIHLKTHAGSKLYFCAFCSFKGRVEAELETHARIHSTQNLFSCAQCLVEFDKSYIMQDHIQAEHASTKGTAKSKNPTDHYASINSSEISVENQMNCDREEKLLKPATLRKEACSNHRNECDSSISVSSSHTESTFVKASGNSGMCDLVQQQPSVYFDSNHTKLVNVSVVLEDLFQKIPRDDSQEPIQRHVNSELCLCVFCTGKFKLRNEEINLVETEVNKNTIESNFFPEEYVRKSVSKKWNSCTLCPARFRFMHSLKRHFATDHYVYLCPECPGKFQARSDFQTHLKTHPGNQLYSCAFCSFKSKVEAELKIHVARIHSMEKLFSCAQCFIEFDRSNNLLDHILKHASKEGTPEFKNRTACLLDEPVSNENSSNLKEKSLASKQLLHANRPTVPKHRPHLKSSSTTHADAKSFSSTHSPSESMASSKIKRCFLTGAGQRLFSGIPNADVIKLTGGDKLQSHVSDKILYATPKATFKKKLDIRSDNSNEKLLSAKCAAVFKTKCHLSQHLAIQSQKKPVSCPHCAATFKWTAYLSRHLVVHSNERPFSCPYCGASFKRKRNLSQHLTIHSNKKAHSCPHCGAGFKVIGTLNRHLAVHSNNDLFACANCTANFKSKIKLLRHSVIHSNKRLFACPHCAAVFRRKRYLTQHLVIHLGKKPFACPKCTATFKREVELQQHSVAHSNERPFACLLCVATFKRKDHLTRHLAVHPEKLLPSLNDAANSKSKFEP